MTDPRPALSVVIATTHAWPEAKPCLDALAPQVAELGGEILVADGHGAGVDRDALPACARVAVVAPGANVFALREAALTHARGEVVALTEDHCVPSPVWCVAMSSALLEIHPEAAAVAGATTNGSPEAAVDRANFLMTFAEMMPPLDRPSLTRVPPAVNAAFRADVLREVASEPGGLELGLLPRLWAEERVVLHRDALVSHVQSHGILRTFAVHFHNGRASAGLHRELTRSRGAAAWLAHPWRLTAFVVRAVRGKGGLRAEWAALPFVVALSLCHVAGEAVGALRGPGASPRALS